MEPFYKIASCYFKLFFPQKKPNINEFKKVLKKSKKVYIKGWTVLQVNRRMCKYHYNLKEKSISFNQLKSRLFENKTPPYQVSENLITPNKYYYHKKLQLYPSPKKVNIKDGNIVRANSFNYLEMKDIFTKKNLYNYFNRFAQKKSFKNNNKKIIDQIIDNGIGLDLFLFTVDYLKMIQKKVYSANILKEYFKKGDEMLKSIKLTKRAKIKPFYKAYLKYLKRKEKEGDYGKP